MKFLNNFVVFAALLAPILTGPSPSAQQTGVEIIDAETVENSCRPRLSKSHYTMTIIEDILKTPSN